MPIRKAVRKAVVMTKRKLGHKKRKAIKDKGPAVAGAVAIGAGVAGANYGIKRHKRKKRYKEHVKWEKAYNQGRLDEFNSMTKEYNLEPVYKKRRQARIKAKKKRKKDRMNRP